MLYISRRVFYNGADYNAQNDSSLRVGVVDTDDGREEFVSLNTLKAISQEGKVNINGLSRNVRGMRDVHPYQIDASPLQTKFRLLRGVSVVTWNGEIVDIDWDNDSIKAPVSIRLSDFAPTCADFVLYGADYTNDHAITLVFDDNISVTESSFEVWPFLGPGGIGVVFDLRGLTNPNTLLALYKTAYRSLEAYDERQFTLPVIDFDDRKERMRKRFYV